MPVLASALAAAMPILIYLLLIWRFDRYEREPFGFVLKNFFWGAIGAVLFSIIGSSIFNDVLSAVILDKKFLELSGAIIVAPIVEEITKGIFLFLVVANRNFDNMTDGIVYGGAIGLGFGMTENFLYFVSFGTEASSWLQLVVIRTLFSAVMHCVSTATLGAFLGFAKFKNWIYKLTFPFIGLSIAIFIHSAWNLSVSFSSTTVLGFVFMFFTITSFVVFYRASVTFERKTILRELSEEVILGTLPESHLSLIRSPRISDNFFTSQDVRKAYLKFLVTLSFRKLQSRNSSGSSRKYYAQQVDYLRNFIQSIQNNF